MEKWTELESLNGMTVKSIEGSSRMVNFMEMEQSHTLMVKLWKDNGIMAKIYRWIKLTEKAE